MRAEDEDPKVFGIMPFQSKEDAVFDIKRGLQKGHFCSKSEKSRGPDPQEPSSCAPGYPPGNGYRVRRCIKLCIDCTFIQFSFMRPKKCIRFS